MKKVLLLSAAALVAVAVGIGSSRKLHVTEYMLRSDKLSGGNRVRIALISDLHNELYGECQDTLVRLIAKKKPDFVALAGDIADDKLGSNNAMSLIRALCFLKMPTYYVAGNHEAYMKDRSDWFDQAREFGVRVLEQSYVNVKARNDRLIIAGAADPYCYGERSNYDDSAYRSSFNEAFSDLPDCYRILLAHRPERYEEYRAAGFDIALSGHAHGGQIRLPKLVNGLYAPHQGIFPPRAGGLYEDGGFVQVVGRGLSNPVMVPRMFNPPELVIVDIFGTKI